AGSGKRPPRAAHPTRCCSRCSRARRSFRTFSIAAGRYVVCSMAGRPFATEHRVSSEDRTDIPSSVREVLAYFLNHPGAPASVRDLDESRIAQESAFHNITQVTEAVEWLLEKRLLVHKYDPILTLNADMVGDAEQLVADLMPRPRGVDAPLRLVEPSSIEGP